MTPSFSLGVLMQKGGSIQAPLLLYGPPAASLEAADKSYVDGKVGGIPDAPLNTTTYGRLNGAWVGVLPLAGGTMTGPITLSADPVAAMQPATQQYVLARVAGYLPVAGGTMSGNLLLNADPTAPLGAATKQYVDSKVAFTDAPLNANAYGRSNGAWVQVMPLTGGTVSGGISGSGAGQTLDNFNLDMGTY